MAQRRVNAQIAEMMKSASGSLYLTLREQEA
jgi:hypothetical protein